MNPQALHEPDSQETLSDSSVNPQALHEPDSQETLSDSSVNPQAYMSQIHKRRLVTVV